MVVDLEELPRVGETREAFEEINHRFVADGVPTRFGLTWDEFEQTE